MEMLGLFSAVSFIANALIIIFVFYITFQFLKESRDRNDLLYQILEELKKKK